MRNTRNRKDERHRVLERHSAAQGLETAVQELAVPLGAPVIHPVAGGDGVPAGRTHVGRSAHARNSSSDSSCATNVLSTRRASSRSTDGRIAARARTPLAPGRSSRTSGACPLAAPHPLLLVASSLPGAAGARPGATPSRSGVLPRWRSIVPPVRLHRAHEGPAP